MKFLIAATRVAGLTYQLAATSVMIGALAVGVYKTLKKSG